jgi:mannose-6-phosphate isomerase
MAIKRLRPKLVEKIWGRRDLPPPFGPIAADRPPVGEIWFEDPERSGDDALLVKYLFTSERLSVQVHPDDEAARRRGLPGGKEEAWWVLWAEDGATIGLGLRQMLSPEALRAASLDGSIEGLLDWRPARSGDHVYSPAGTVHALGPGLSVIEVQQNRDVTYRLFDYGRDRELHLDAAVAVARPEPFEPERPPRDLGAGRTVLAEDRAFVLERWQGARASAVRAGAPVWIVPIAGGGTIGGERLEPGGVWRVTGETALSLDGDSDLLVAYDGGDVQERLV